MIDLLNVYECLHDGEVLADQVYYHEHIDIDRDEVYPAWHCAKCKAEVQLKVENSLPVYRAVDHERWLHATGFYDDLAA